MREKLYGIEGEVTLKDGTVIHVRPVRRDDEKALYEFYSSLSPKSLTMRFFSIPPESFLKSYIRDEVKRASEMDYKKSFGVVALFGDRIIAHAVYHAKSPDLAEVAFAVADDFQGRGVCTILLGILAEVAERNGIKIFEAAVRPDNYKMIEVFRDSGFPIRLEVVPDEIIVEMPTSITEEVLEYFERREQIATINALNKFFYPKSIAVIGASRDRNKIGGRVFYNAISYGFNGVVYPVNKSAKTVQGIRAYKSISEIPDDIDLAVIAVPAESVLEVAEECGKKGVKAIIVISAGFAEIGEEGRKRQEELLRICRKYGMRLIGPNCMGIVNTNPDVRLNVTFAPNPPIEGRIGFASQSGAIGLAIINYANSYNLGLSAFVSLGNRADISSNDLIEYWENDERTDLIMLHLESFGNPRKFSRISRRVSKKKPILALASGLTPAGAKAAMSHTGAILSSSGVVVDALFKQVGIIRVDTLDELFAIASFLLHQPLPNGKRVCIITNGGGLGVLTADWCQGMGLEVPDLSEKTQKTLRDLLPKIASVRNPIDMGASATPEDYEKVIRIAAEDEVVDVVIAIFVQVVSPQEAEDVKKAVLSAAKYVNSLRKPIIFIHVSSDAGNGIIRDGEIAIPTYAFPNIAAEVIVKAVEYADWIKKPKEPIPRFDVNRDKAAAIIAKSLSRGEWMRLDDAFELLQCYGLDVPEFKTALSLEEARKIVKEFNNKAVLKTLTDCKVVSFDELKNGEEILVQKSIDEECVDVLIGVTTDPSFGPLITCGLKGEYIEIFRDFSVRLTPITRSEAYEMIKNLKSYSKLVGFDIDSLADAILRISTLVEDFPEIFEMDCEVAVLKSNVLVTNAKIRLKALHSYIMS